MEHVDAGIFSIIPPLIAIGLALITKEVISSLIIGILSGTLIYSILITDGFFNVSFKTFEVTAKLMSDKLGENAAILIFLAFLGALVVVITKAGGSKAYGDWAGSKIKSRRSAKLATSALGSLIFIDDYFNCLTVGTVMKPVTDKYKISHAKLAYIIDSTAAPICIIAPVSSWAASVISYMSGTGLDGMNAFIQTIPINLYAILSIILMLVLSITDFDFGLMRKFERNAMESDFISSSITDNSESEDELSRLKISEKGRVLDLIIPISILIVTSVFSMLYIGGYFEGNKSIAQAFGDTDAGIALAISGFITLLATMILFIPRKIISFKEFMSGITTGVKSMVGVYIILTLAWTISGVCRNLLNTGVYVGDLVANSHMPVQLIPVIVFIVAGFLSFSMGTSWGTFGILIPIVATLCQNVAPDLTIIAIAATLSGSVFGDHCSPISDTTILSSTGASCNHMDHVSSQMIYALVVAGCSAIGYIVAGFTANVLITVIVSISLLAITLLFYKFLDYRKYKKSQIKS